MDYCDKIFKYKKVSVEVLSTGYEDEIAHWWAAAIKVATLWLLGEDEQAHRVFAKLENIPHFLEANQDTLPRALLATFRYFSAFHFPNNF